ncbi:MAG: acetate kinase, partial [Desulfobacterales bacterium]
MKILVLNSGSSSIKYQLFDMRTKTVLASGIIEQIGERQSRLTHQTRSDQGSMDEIIKTEAVADHLAGFQLMGGVLKDSGALRDTGELSGIGHRVVHGGEAFKAPTLINKTVI